MAPRLLRFLRRRNGRRSAANGGGAASNPTKNRRSGPESSSGQIPGTEEKIHAPLSLSTFSSTYHTPPSSLSSPSPVAMVCSVCNTGRSDAGGFLLNMLGCSHVLCVDCFMKVQAAGEEAAARPCPVADCDEGFFLSDATAAADTVEEEDDGGSFYCSICMESRPLDEGFMDIKGCTHVFCSECIAQYAAAKVEENAVSVACPDTSCSSGFLEPEACRPILDPQVYLRWGAALCEASIEGKTKVYCPYGDCSALLVNDGKVSSTACPHCGRMLCGRCKVPWHAGMTCKEFRDVGGGQGASSEDLEVMKMAAKSSWRRCPECGFFVERVSGCVFIRCKHCFCYRCGSTMDKKDRKHYCSRCQVTWDNTEVVT